MSNAGRPKLSIRWAVLNQDTGYVEIFSSKKAATAFAETLRSAGAPAKVFRDW